MGYTMPKNCQNDIENVLKTQGRTQMASSATQELLPNVEELPERKSGIWPSQRIWAAVELGQIRGEDRISQEQVQPASLDLRLGSIAYRVPASFLPGRKMKVKDKVDLLFEEKINIENGAVLRKGKVYIVQLQEILNLRKRVSGIANPKSSTGRLDVFCRVITDYGTEFDTIHERYAGPLWLEIAPRSFDVMVYRGSRLAQVRLRQGTPPSSDTFVRKLNEALRIVRGGDRLDDIKDGAIALSVDATGDPVSGLIGYKAKNNSEFVDVEKINYYDPNIFWEKIYRRKSGGIILEMNDFHILATKERVALPANFAADMVAYDTLVGEFRAHYAGFFDPGFGYAGGEPQGTKIVLEVRSHEVPFIIEDGQNVGRVVVERLEEPTDKPYGSGIGSSYQHQGLTLSKQFKR